MMWGTGLHVATYIRVGKSKKVAELVFVEGKQYSAAILHKKLKGEKGRVRVKTKL